MHCTQAHDQFDDYIDDMLPPFQRTALERHLQTCHDCRAQLQAQRDMLQHLRSLPVPPPSPGFAARVLRQAAQSRQRRFGVAAMFGSAVAAGLAMWLVIGVWFATPAHNVPVAGVRLAVNQAQTLSLAFNSPNAIDNVTLSLELPQGVYLKGRPGQRTLVWQDRLAKGRNVLRLDVVATQPAAGDIVAKVQHAAQTKAFRIRLNAVAEKPQHTMVQRAVM